MNLGGVLRAAIPTLVAVFLLAGSASATEYLTNGGFASSSAGWSFRMAGGGCQTGGVRSLSTSNGGVTSNNDFDLNGYDANIYAFVATGTGHGTGCVGYLTQTVTIPSGPLWFSFAWTPYGGTVGCTAAATVKLNWSLAIDGTTVHTNTESANPGWHLATWSVPSGTLPSGSHTLQFSWDDESCPPFTDPNALSGSDVDRLSLSDAAPTPPPAPSLVLYKRITAVSSVGPTPGPSAQPVITIPTPDPSSPAGVTGTASYANPLYSGDLITFTVFFTNTGAGPAIGAANAAYGPVFTDSTLLSPPTTSALTIVSGSPQFHCCTGPSSNDITASYVLYDRSTTAYNYGSGQGPYYMFTWTANARMPLPNPAGSGAPIQGSYSYQARMP